MAMDSRADGGTALKALAVALCLGVAQAHLPVAQGDAILFVGNSFTGEAGGLDVYVRMALADGPSPVQVSTGRSLSYGYDIDYLYNTSDAVSQIETGDWDIVVLQGYWSGIDDPPGSLDTFDLYVDRFDSVIAASGAQTVLFMPWTSSPTTSGINWTTYALESRAFRDNHRSTGLRIDAPVAPCGWVWYDLVTDKPDTTLPDDFLYGDAIHQNELASYVNAYVFYTLLTHRSPVGLDFHYTTVTNVVFDDALRTVLQERVWDLMQEWLPQEGVRFFARGAGGGNEWSGTRYVDLRGRLVSTPAANAVCGVLVQSTPSSQAAPGGAHLTSVLQGSSTAGGVR